jgi:hypothetical protein
MNRPPDVDVKSILPGGIRTAHDFGSGSYIKVPQYKAAGVRTFELAKNVDLIVKELGLDYLSGLKRLRGQNDGFMDWSESPIDFERLRGTSDINAVVVQSLQKTCSDYRNKNNSYCIALKRARIETGYFFTYADSRIVILDPRSRGIHIAYSGPYTGARR